MMTSIAGGLLLAFAPLGEKVESGLPHLVER